MLSLYIINSIHEELHRCGIFQYLIQIHKLLLLFQVVALLQVLLIWYCQGQITRYLNRCLYNQDKNARSWQDRSSLFWLWLLVRFKLIWFQWYQRSLEYICQQYSSVVSSKFMIVSILKDSLVLIFVIKYYYFALIFLLQCFIDLQ